MARAVPSDKGNLLIYNRYNSLAGLPTVRSRRQALTTIGG